MCRVWFLNEQRKMNKSQKSNNQQGCLCIVVTFKNCIQLCRLAVHVINRGTMD